MSKQPNQYTTNAADIARDAAAELGFLLMKIDQINTGEFNHGKPEIRRISIRMGITNSEETLVTVASWDEDGTPAVAFHSADKVSEALRGAITRYLNGQLDWKEDGYYK